MRLMLRNAVVGAGVFASIALAPPVGAAGLEGLHQHVQVGNKICMVDHFHHGQTSGWQTREQAEVSAAQSWSGFTALEYGAEWADYRLAVQPSMECQQSASDRGGVVWSCRSKAIPCKKAPSVTALPGALPVYRAVPATRTATVPHLRRWQGERYRRAHPVEHAQQSSLRVPAAKLVWPGDAR